MSKKNISDYMPDSNEPTKLVQAKVNKALADQFKPVLRAERQSFKAFLEACMMKFIDEKKSRGLR